MTSEILSATPTRRVLGDLNVNTPAVKSLTSAKEAFTSSNPTKIAKRYPIEAYQKNHYQGVGILQQENIKEVSMSGQKRGASLADDAIKSSPKRFCPSETTTTVASLHKEDKGTCEVRIPITDNTRLNGDDRAATRACINNQEVNGEELGEDSDRCSWAGSSIAGVNDSQNTILTEPDEAPALLANSSRITFDSFLPSPPRHLSREEIREKAKVLRLRLRLANYKVKTNQINVPMSRLQIRPSGCSPNMAPTLSGNLPQASAFPSELPSLSNVSHFNLQEPSSDRPQNDNIASTDDANIPSSPPLYHSPNKDSENPASPVKASDTPLPASITTSLLPYQHEGINNPPALCSPVHNDLPGSTIKDRAADGLLSLMRRQEE